MSYLNCKACNMYTEINSQYLTFCAHCGKKLENSFFEWQVNNRGKSFEDYKTSVGIENPMLAAQKVQSKYSPLPMYFFAGLGVLFTAMLCYASVKIVTNIAGSFPGVPYDVGMPKQTEPSDPRLWSKKMIGDMGYTMLTPYEFKPLQLPLPPETKQLLRSSECFQALDQQRIIIFVFNFEVTNEVTLDETTILDMANSLSNVMITHDINDMERKNFVQDNKKGMLLTGDVKMGPANCTVFMHVLLDAPKAYTSMYIIQKGDTDAAKEAQRMFESVVLESGAVL